jgi:phosphoglucomutase
MKIYLSCIGNSMDNAEKNMEDFKKNIMEIVDNACNN